MNKVKRKELVEKANDHELRLFQIEKALEQHGINWFTEEPKLKQLDQSVFDGLDAKWRFAAVPADGRALYFSKRPHDSNDITGHFIFIGDYKAGLCGEGYDTSNWQNSLIERDIAKELLEVDLSSELTGSDLTEQIMKSQKYQPAFVSDKSEQDAINSQRTALIDNVYVSDRDYRFRAELNGHRYAVSINNQGEPLTQSDVGL